jgi:hypothetical protein
MTIITIALKRAEDLAESDVIHVRRSGSFSLGDWRLVYEVARFDMPSHYDEDMTRIFGDEIDDRYVLLRIADDPRVKIGQKDGQLHTWIEGSATDSGHSGGTFGVPPDYPDEYVVLNRYDLVEVQTLVQAEPDEAEPEDRSEQTVFRLTATDIDEQAGRKVTDDELARVAKALGHSSIPDAVSDVVGVVCEPSYCRVCGEPMWLDENEVSHHWSSETIDNIDHDADADHVALAEEQL